MEDFWRKLSQEERDKCLRDAFKAKNAALAKLVLESGKISKREVQLHIYESIRIMKDVELLNLLLDMGAEATASELNAAAEIGNVEMVDIVMADGVKAAGESIIYASKQGHNDVVIKLLEAGGKCKTHHSKPINEAAFNGHHDVVETLLRYGEDANNLRPNVIERVKRLADIPGYTKFAKTLKILEEAGLKTE